MILCISYLADFHIKSSDLSHSGYYHHLYLSSQKMITN